MTDIFCLGPLSVVIDLPELVPKQWGLMGSKFNGMKPSLTTYVNNTDDVVIRSYQLSKFDTLVCCVYYW